MSIRLCDTWQAGRMDWTVLLAKAGIAEPPGRPELVELIRREREELVDAGGQQQPVKRKRRRGKH